MLRHFAIAAMAIFSAISNYNACCTTSPSAASRLVAVSANNKGMKRKTRVKRMIYLPPIA
jgi:hypothetical protein